MLSRVTLKYWDDEITKDLCNNLQTFAKKRDEILVCKSPILFCALIAEFLTAVSEASLSLNLCLEAAENFKDLGVSIENSIKDESVLSYYL